MAADGDGHGDGVIGHGQPEVLQHEPPRLARQHQGRRDRRQTVPQKHRVRMGLRQMGCRDRRQGHMGGGQRGRVVQPIAYHQHPAPLPLQFLQTGDLVGGLQRTRKMRNGKLARHSGDRFHSVA